LLLHVSVHMDHLQGAQTQSHSTQHGIHTQPEPRHWQYFNMFMLIKCAFVGHKKLWYLSKCMVLQQQQKKGVLIFYEIWPQSILQHLQFLLHHWWIFRSAYQLTCHHILAQSNLSYIVYLGFQTWWNSKFMYLLYILKLQNEIT
jgi:hypothetical protein